MTQTEPTADELPTSDMPLFEAIYTQRAIRSFKTDPVPEPVLRRIIEAATKAPNGGNAQPWAFIVVTDAEKRARFAELAKEGFQPMLARALANQRPGDPPPLGRLTPMIERFEDIPALIVVCFTKPVDKPDAPVGQGSIYPAVQNLLLAARALGVGSVLTTGWAQPVMPQIKELLGLPPHVEPVSFLPLGYPDKERFGPTTRRPVDEVTHWQGWEGDKGNSATPTHR